MTGRWTEFKYRRFIQVKGVAFLSLNDKRRKISCRLHNMFTKLDFFSILERHDRVHIARTFFPFLSVSYR